MSRFHRILLSAAVLAMTSGAVAGTVRAEGLRAVLVGGAILDGTPRDAALVEATTVEQFEAAGFRFVDLDTALAGQRALLADMVADGRLPEGISTLQADAVVSVHLACDAMAEKLLGSDVRAFQCSARLKVLRVGTGAVVHSHAKTFIVHSLRGAMALRSASTSRLAPVLKSQAKAVLDAWAGDGLATEMVVSGVRGLAHRDSLRARLLELPGVADVRAVYLRESVAKFELRNAPGASAQTLAQQVEASTVPVRVTRQAGSSLHVQVDATKVHTRDVIVGVSLPPRGRGRELVSSVGPDIVQAALRDLPSLRPRYSRPLVAAPPALVRVSRRARRRAGVLLLSATLERHADAWHTRWTVSDGKGRSIVSAVGEGPDATQAARKAASMLDASMRAGFAEAEDRTPIEARSAGGQASAVVVDRFVVGRQDAAELSLRNAGTGTLEQCRVELSVAGTSAAGVPCQALAPGQEQNLVLPLDSLPADVGADRYTTVSATIRYRNGEAERVARATTVWLHGAPHNPQVVAERQRRHARRSYERLVREGLAASQAGEFEEAKQLFQRAHRTRPSARTLRALALVSFDLGEYDAMRRFARDALGSGTRPLTTGMRHELSDLVARSRLFETESALAVQ